MPKPKALAVLAALLNSPVVKLSLQFGELATCHQALEALAAPDAPAPDKPEKKPKP